MTRLEWQPTTEEDMVLQFLKAEIDRLVEICTASYGAACGSRVRGEAMALTTDPDLTSSKQNRQRREMMKFRNGILNEIPHDTTWFRVKHLTRNHLPFLLAINDTEWTHESHRNEILEVAKIRNFKLRKGSNPNSWPPPILWGHVQSGPLTILEGNNRLCALAGSRCEFSIEVIVGLSTKACGWHLPDKPVPQ